MYRYDNYDQQIVDERVAQFRGHVARRLEGKITEEEFKPMRLQNGLYMQLHAYMLRVAIPYGLLSTKQLRMLAHIARKYDKGYGHWSTRQNLQYNWPKLQEVPDLLADLASVEMHAIQTSGNCIRNVTADHLAGAARDEIEDPRPVAEIIRQWSTFHPEFAFLPRKFKIAVTGAPDCDRAAVRFHDIGVRIVRNAQGENGFEILAGGGLGRTPIVAPVIREFLPREHLLSYLEAILRVYNLEGRRDNPYKARIKILVAALGRDKFAELVEAEWEQIKDGGLKLTQQEIDRVSKFFEPPVWETLPDSDAKLEAAKLSSNRDFARWVSNNVIKHKAPGYSIAMISVKEKGRPPGDMSDTQMDAVADLADKFSMGELVVTHTQNLVFQHVKTTDLFALWEQLVKLDLATANAGLLTDIICCPGLDFCALANARSIPVAMAIRDRFDDIDYLSDLGELSVKISGCINACGHHHVGNIGILGIDKQGVEHYQISLGGSPGNDAAVGKILGRAFPQDKIVDAIDTLLKAYLTLRTSDDERFLDTYRRVGEQPFKDAVYGDH